MLCLGNLSGSLACIAVLVCLNTAFGQPATMPIVISGPEQQQLDLSKVGAGIASLKGVQTYPVFRADREHPEASDGKGWTYHHHPDLACWKGRLYVGWNSCEKDEDTWPSRELYSTSSDGMKWSAPAELFPQGVSTPLRMYFFHAPNKRMLAIAGYRVNHEKTEERLKGPLVVREIRADHTLATVFALQGSGMQPLPKYQESDDPGFVEACNQLLATRIFLEQQDYGTLLGDRKMSWHDINNWPNDRRARFGFRDFARAMSFFHRKDGALVGIGKKGFTIVSNDEGQTWSQPVQPPTLVTGNAKVWGQRTSDGRYALVYNPDPRIRFPLVLVSGDDGAHFANMRVVFGDKPEMRYPGLNKSAGPQYTRGISEWASDGSWQDSAMWIVYSVNKEDICVSRIAVPIQTD